MANENVNCPILTCETSFKDPPFLKHRFFSLDHKRCYRLLSPLPEVVRREQETDTNRKLRGLNRRLKVYNYDEILLFSAVELSPTSRYLFAFASFAVVRPTVFDKLSLDSKTQIILSWGQRDLLPILCFLACLNQYHSDFMWLSFYWDSATRRAVISGLPILGCCFS